MTDNASPMTDKSAKIRAYVSLSGVGFMYSPVYLIFSLSSFYDFYDKKRRERIYLK
jgi:hypothetical protein